MTWSWVLTFSLSLSRFGFYPFFCCTHLCWLLLVIQCHPIVLNSEYGEDSVQRKLFEYGLCVCVWYHDSCANRVLPFGDIQSTSAELFPISCYFGFASELFHCLVRNICLCLLRLVAFVISFLKDLPFFSPPCLLKNRPGVFDLS